MSQITARTLKGFRDFLPAEMLQRQHVIGVIEDIFKRYGFEPLQTPTLEYLDILMGKYGEEADKLVYAFEDHGGRRIGLRYDLTVPTSKVLAMYPNLPKPFKRYQIQPVWRADKPQKGRFREFIQCDQDIFGASGELADAEVIAVAVQAFRALGFEDFGVEINDRRILGGIARYAGVPEDKAGYAVFVAIDKLDKIGIDGVEAELKARGNDDACVAKILELIQLRGTNAEILDQLAERLNGDTAAGDAIERLRKTLAHLTAMGVPDKYTPVNPALARGLAYYTGIVFEVIGYGSGVGSLGAGGRYDGLIGSLGGPDTPAVGMSFGIERIVTVMADQAMFPPVTTTAQVLVCVFDAERTPAALETAATLRTAGLAVEVYLKDGDKIGKQLAHAARKGIPVAVIVGPEEHAAGQAQVKDLVTGTQETVALGAAADHIARLLANR